MKKLSLMLALLLFFGAVAAQATVVLDFAGLKDQEPIDNYYNGGFGGLGSGPGPNYGIAFTSDSLALISSDKGGTGNFSLNPGVNIAFFLNGAGDTMNVAAGFTTGFSFYYASPFYSGSVGVYDGLNGSGNLLATLSLANTPGYCDPNHAYSCWVAQGVTFAGTAESVVFSGVANYIGFADITLGSKNPGSPEPGTLIMLGSGVLGLAGVLRRKFMI